MTRKFFVILLSVNDTEEVLESLLAFKTVAKKNGDVQVVRTSEDTYDYLYNTLLERANQIQKWRTPIKTVANPCEGCPDLYCGTCPTYRNLSSRDPSTGDE